MLASAGASNPEAGADQAAPLLHLRSVWPSRSKASVTPSLTIASMDRTFLLVGALAGLIGVAFGAFGAHALRGRLSPDLLAVFETGVRYQMYHAFAVLVVAIATAR